jgi:hypothetical protein
MGFTQPVKVNSMRGQVIKDLYGKGSKSEHEAVFIETDDGRYILRHKNGPAFGDTTLIQYIGHEVECDGFLVGTTLLAERIEMND